MATTLVTLICLLPLLIAGMPVQPVALTQPGELADFYSQTTGDAPNAGYFGVYAIQPFGETLYLGLGTGRPAEADGALLARLDGTNLQPLARLDEQGFVDMTLAQNRIYIPGADPTDDWDAGNLYVHEIATGRTTKLRTLPNTIHAWQARIEADGRLRVAVGRYLPERGVWPWAGGILTSTNGGRTWAADDSPALGTSRTYDLVEGAAADVALVDDAALEGCQLATRPKDGSASGAGVWQRGNAWVLCRLRLASDPAGRRVLAVGAGGRSLVVAGGEQTIPLPFRVDDWTYHWHALAGRTLYVATADGRVLAHDDIVTTDLRSWREVAALGQPIVSLAYWPARSALVVATRGAQGQLWLVPVGPGN